MNSEAKEAMALIVLGASIFMAGMVWYWFISGGAN